MEGSGQADGESPASRPRMIQPDAATDPGAVVVGAGPAGLAVSACLTRAGVSHVVFEREATVGSAWRRHYDRLHLHTSRGFSALPYHPMPRSYPRYPSRDQVVGYLEQYAESEGLRPRLGVEVRRITHEGRSWLVDTSEGAVRCRAVVLATGVNARPVRPQWEGLSSFPGSMLHSADYRTGAPFAGLDVLVVGFGNSGGEIALDLLEHGARPVISVRGPVNIVPRDILGIPVLGIAIPLAKLPPGLADLLVWPLLKGYYPSYARLGLRRASSGPFRQIDESGRVPLLDIGTVREIRRGRIEVRSGVVRIVGSSVHFHDGRTSIVVAIVFATGYEPAVVPGIDELPTNASGVHHPGLYFCGFHVSPTGMLREIAREARAIAARIREE
jgi:indole-3-pyruvate monooxygenase